MYIPRLSYDIGRNIIVRDKNQDIKQGKEDYDYFKSLLNSSKARDMLYIIFPVFCTLMKNRKA